MFIIKEKKWEKQIIKLYATEKEGLDEIMNFLRLETMGYEGLGYKVESFKKYKGGKNWAVELHDLTTKTILNIYELKEYCVNKTNNIEGQNGKIIYHNF